MTNGDVTRVLREIEEIWAHGNAVCETPARRAALTAALAALEDRALEPPTPTGGICAHVRSYWCDVTHPGGRTDVRYCSECGEALEYRGVSVPTQYQEQVGHAPRVRLSGEPPNGAQRAPTSTTGPITSVSGQAEE